MILDGGCEVGSERAVRHARAASDREAGEPVDRVVPAEAERVRGRHGRRRAGQSEEHLLKTIVDADLVTRRPSAIGTDPRRMGASVGGTHDAVL